MIRDGKRTTVTVTVGNGPTEEALAKFGGGGCDRRSDGSNRRAGTARSEALGLSLGAADPELARAASLPATAQRRGRRRGRSRRATRPSKGLQRGDLIVSVNNQPVTTPAAGDRRGVDAREGRAARACCCSSSAAQRPARYVGGRRSPG